MMQEGASSVSCFYPFYILDGGINNLQNDDMSRLYVKMSLWLYTRRCKVLLELFGRSWIYRNFSIPDQECRKLTPFSVSRQTKKKKKETTDRAICHWMKDI